MKKLFLSAAFVVAFFVGANAEIVQRDTIAFSGQYTLDKVVKVNSFGETRTDYVAVLQINGKSKKVRTDKATYTKGEVSHIIWHTNAEGDKKIAKAVAL